MIKKIFSIIAVISLSNIIYSVNLQADDLTTFDEWLSNIENLAIERGISKNTADNALNNLERNPRVIELDRDQPEFTLTHEEYLNNTVTESRAKKGKDLYNEHKILLNKIPSPSFTLILQNPLSPQSSSKIPLLFVSKTILPFESYL